MPVLKARKQLGASISEVYSIPIVKANIKFLTTRMYFRTKIFKRLMGVLTFQFHVFVICVKLEFGHCRSDSLPPSRQSPSGRTADGEQGKGAARLIAARRLNRKC